MNKRRLSLLALLTVLCLPGLWVAGPFHAQARFEEDREQAPAQADWKVGLAQVKITPQRPLFMSGYGGRTKPFTKIEHDLFVKALALEDAGGRRAVLVTSDILGFAAEIAEPICTAIGKKTGLKREQILLNSAHTHTGDKARVLAKKVGR